MKQSEFADELMRRLLPVIRAEVAKAVGPMRDELKELTIEARVVKAVAEAIAANSKDARVAERNE